MTFLWFNFFVFVSFLSLGFASRAAHVRVSSRHRHSELLSVSLLCDWRSVFQVEDNGLKKIVLSSSPTLLTWQLSGRIQLHLGK